MKKGINTFHGNVVSNVRLVTGEDPQSEQARRDVIGALAARELLARLAPSESGQVPS